MTPEKLSLHLPFLFAFEPKTPFNQPVKAPPSKLARPKRADRPPLAAPPSRHSPSFHASSAPPSSPSCPPQPATDISADRPAERRRVDVDSVRTPNGEGEPRGGEELSMCEVGFSQVTCPLGVPVTCHGPSQN